MGKIVRIVKWAFISLRVEKGEEGKKKGRMRGSEG